ncbi:MAG: Lysophospholipid transporter LplT / 2-acylglycerophosphoethanolamine acyltransferase, partial [uncultured Lysobacter sp.]
VPRRATRSTTQPVRTAHATALRAVLPDAVAGRVQRQRVPAGGHRPAVLSGHRCGTAHAVHEPRAGAFHPALLPVLGHGRADRREAGQGPADPHHDRDGDRDHVARRGGIPDAEPRGAAHRAVLHGRAVHAVRAGQVFGAAGGAAFARIDRRQWSGRDGYVACDPDRHDCRRHDLPGRRRGRALDSGQCGCRARNHRTPRQPCDPARRAGRAGAARAVEPDSRIDRDPEAREAPAGGAQRDPRRVVVLVRGHGADRAAADVRGAAPGRRCGPVHLRARAVFGRYRRRFAVVREAVGTHGGDRSGAAGRVRYQRVPAGSLLPAQRARAGARGFVHGVSRVAERLAHCAGSGRHRVLGRRVRGAAVRADPEPHAGQRDLARDRRHEYPERGFHRAGRRPRHRPAAGLGLVDPAAAARARDRECAGGGVDLHDRARIPDALSQLGAGAHAVPAARARHRPHPRRRRGAGRVQPRELHGRADPGR